MICEFGAGDGTMACDILQTLINNDTPPEQYIIIEKVAIYAPNKNND